MNSVDAPRLDDALWPSSSGEEGRCVHFPRDRPKKLTTTCRGCFRSTMKESRIHTRLRWCPRCGARMWVNLNPFYGVGLAVHRYFSTCTRCGFVEFLPTAQHDNDVNHPVAPPQAPRGGDTAARSQSLRRWASTHRISISLALFVATSIAVLAVALLR